MLKKELEQKLKEYKEILTEIGKWAFPVNYKLNEEKALFHIEGIKKILENKFYTKGDNNAN